MSNKTTDASDTVKSVVDAVTEYEARRYAEYVDLLKQCLDGQPVDVEHLGLTASMLNKTAKDVKSDLETYRGYCHYLANCKGLADQIKQLQAQREALGVKMQKLHKEWHIKHKELATWTGARMPTENEAEAALTAKYSKRYSAMQKELSEIDAALRSKRTAERGRIAGKVLWERFRIKEDNQ